jgi:beta-glucosidase-like glycosyl hydrolase/CubicO group peptidase (beta-lactamase class C family)
MVSDQLKTEKPRLQYDDALATRWADSVLNGMSLKEKIGQLFMVEAYSNKDEAHAASVLNLIQRYHIGGVIFFQGSPHKQAVLTNRFQAASKMPLMIGIDGEWGLSMRLDSTIRFPRQMTLGATSDDSLMYLIGEEIARQCKRIGIHINFAPVVDINTNPINPVINSRSFGEKKELVSRMSQAYMHGMQDYGVLACAKHFPGHGNTDSDSHFTLPIVRELESHLDSVELFPFKSLISAGVASMMVAHLNIPSLDPTPSRASTLSPLIVDGLLRKKLGFDGLVFTDALNMKGVADYFEPGELAVMALKAGNDVLLFSRDVPKAWTAIHEAVDQGVVTLTELNDKVRRILKAKHRAGLHTISPVELNNLTADLNSSWAGYLAQKAYESSLVLLQNKDMSLPLRMDNHCAIATLSINEDEFGVFYQSISRMMPISKFKSGTDLKESQISKLVNELSAYDQVIVGIHKTTVKSAGGYGIPNWTDNLLARLASRTRLVTVLFGNTYALSRIPSAIKGQSVLVAHEDSELAQMAASQFVNGVSSTSAKLPASAGSVFKYGDGLSLKTSMLRLREAYPYEVNLSPIDFKVIDSIANKLIFDRAAPGCQVLVAWKDRVVFHKAFGRHGYEKGSKKVELTDMYDAASITKIAATGLAAMKLVDEGKLDVKRTVSYYLPELKNTNKSDLPIHEIMTHTSGLKNWIPFWQKTMANGKPSYDIYHKTPDANYHVPVCDSLFMSWTYRETMWSQIKDSELGTRGRYVYSDLGLIIMQRIIEKISGTTLDSYVYQHFFQPLGLVNIQYNPWRNIDMDRIPPTEKDTSFRKKLIKGYVHDQAAAMLGGVSGHAGLFSDSYSLAVIMQMLLNGGEYGGKRFLKGETVKLFTSQYSESDGHRGLLFDKPDRRKGESENTARMASTFTFGHTGFTGTAAWADPEHDLIFIFLSNRVHPDTEPNKMSKGRYRPNMMQAAYDVILRKATLPKPRFFN